MQVHKDVFLLASSDIIRNYAQYDVYTLHIIHDQ